MTLITFKKLEKNILYTMALFLSHLYSILYSPWSLILQLV